MTDLRTKKVLVSGASGWLGNRLVNVLLQGLPDDDRLAVPQPHLDIRCLVMPGQGNTDLRELSDRVEIVEGDLRDEPAMERFCTGGQGAILFHCAGVIHPGRVREFYDVNVSGTKALLAAAVKAGVRRVVVVSSNSPCGCNPDRDHRFNEASPYHPYMNYGRSKMLMEQAVGELQRAGKIEAVVIRPPWFYGPYQPPRQTEFFRMIRDGKVPIVGDGNNRRSMCFIDNLCLGLLLAAVTPKAAGQTYWIADATPYTMNEIVDTVERLMEKEFKIPCAHKRLRLPGLVSEMAWLADKIIQAAGLYNQKVHVLSEMNKTIACSAEKARQELGYVPRVALLEGMRRSLAWLTQNRPQDLAISTSTQ